MVDVQLRLRQPGDERRQSARRCSAKIPALFRCHQTAPISSASEACSVSQGPPATPADRPQTSIETAWISSPARAPTTVPLIRMNCRSRPTLASILRDASSASQLATVSEISEVISPR